MSEINKPTSRVYWVARDADGIVISHGYTDPDQVTTSGADVFIQGTIVDQVEDIKQFVPNQPAFNYVLDPETKEWVFPTTGHVLIPAAPHIAEDLSRAIYKLMVPEGDGLYAAIINHPSGQAFPLLQFKETDVIPVSLETDPQPLIDALTIAVQGGGLTQQELDGIVVAVQAQAGQEINIVDFVPPSWQQYVLTYEQARAYGYFGE